MVQPRVQRFVIDIVGLVNQPRFERIYQRRFR
jgi:hypothetical protein